MNVNAFKLLVNGETHAAAIDHNGHRATLTERFVKLFPTATVTTVTITTAELNHLRATL